MDEYLDRRYALALYQVAEEKSKVKEYLEQLKDVVGIISDNKDLFELMKQPQISTSSKKEVLISVFKGKIEEDILSFLLLLTDKGRILQVEGMFKEMERVYLDRNNTIIAKVKTVVSLQDDEKEELINKLQRKYNKKVILQEELDGSIIGGVYIQVDNEVIDGTVKSRIEEMKKLMLKRE